MKLTKKHKMLLGIGGVAALAYYFLVYRKKGTSAAQVTSGQTASSGLGSCCGSLGSGGLGSLGGSRLGSLG